MIHFHLKYVPRTGAAETNYSTSFFSEMEALSAAGTANATRGAESAHYEVQSCQRAVCRPQAPDFELKRLDTTPRVKVPSGR